MKNKILFLFVIIFCSCSFDNKSGIWKNENLITEENNDSFREFKKLSITYSPFNKIVNIKKNFYLSLLFYSIVVHLIINLVFGKMRILFLKIATIFSKNLKNFL